jgi:VanZ like protein
MTARRTGIALSALVLMVVFVATLTPSNDASSPDFLCIACGELGGLDVLNNIVLFLPLGFAFALASGHRWRSVLACVAVTTFIESMQVRIVAGRDSSLSDLLANSLGGLVGVELAMRRAIVTTLTSLGLRPATIPWSLWIQWTPERESFEPFTGKLLDFKLDTFDLPRGYFPPKSLGLDHVLARPGWHATVTVETAGVQRRRSVIARIAEEYTVLVSIEQHRWALACEEKTRSADFRFRSPQVTLPEALTPGLTSSRLRFTCAREGVSLVAATDDRQEVLRLSPSLGWVLLDPFKLTMPRYLWLGSLWLMGLAFPAGYWARCCAEERTENETPRRDSLNGPSIAVGALAVALLIGLLIVPMLSGTAPAAWWEWASAAGGALAGSGVAWLWTGWAARPAIRRGGASVTAVSDPAQ